MFIWTMQDVIQLCFLAVLLVVMLAYGIFYVGERFLGRRK